MLILMQNRKGPSGGDVVQMMETKAALERLGVEVHLDNNTGHDLEPYDVIHLFNLTFTEQTHQLCRTATLQGKPVALSPIYWNVSEYLYRGARGDTWPQDLLFSLRHAFPSLPPSAGRPLQRTIPGSLTNLTSRFPAYGRISRRNERGLQELTLRQAKLILPNAPSEANLICHDFGPDLANKMQVVPNAVNPEVRDHGMDWFYKKTGLSQYVLCVGSIYSRKNQLTLVRALDGTGVDVVLVGATPSRRYLQMCMRHCKGRLYVVGSVRHSRLGAIYARAALHVQPSWYETPGLSSLEAAFAGCRVVCTSRGTARDYFGNLVTYCDPGSERSVRGAVLSSLEEPVPQELARVVERDFNWNKVGAETLEAYRRILGAGERHAS